MIPPDYIRHSTLGIECRTPTSESGGSLSSLCSSLPIFIPSSTRTTTGAGTCTTGTVPYGRSVRCRCGRCGWCITRWGDLRCRRRRLCRDERYGYLRSCTRPRPQGMPLGTDRRTHRSRSGCNGTPSFPIKESTESGQPLDLVLFARSTEYDRPLSSDDPECMVIGCRMGFITRLVLLCGRVTIFR